MVFREIWKPVRGYKGWYSVSNLGYIRRDKPERGAKPGVRLPGTPDAHGRYVVQLCKNGIRDMRKIAHLVLEAFVGARPKGKLCLHWDDVLSNNALSNLRWGTGEQNWADAKRNGRIKRSIGWTSESAKKGALTRARNRNA